jgi:hypothetical protein
MFSSRSEHAKEKVKLSDATSTTLFRIVNLGSPKDPLMKSVIATRDSLPSYEQRVCEFYSNTIYLMILVINGSNRQMETI